MFFYHFQNIVRHCTVYKYQKQLRVFPQEFSLQIERCRTILVSRVTVRSRDMCDCHILSFFFFFLTEITHVAALTTRTRLWHIRETVITKRYTNQTPQYSHHAFSAISIPSAAWNVCRNTKSAVATCIVILLLYSNVNCDSSIPQFILTLSKNC